jgi:hypothetical protein
VATAQWPQLPEVSFVEGKQPASSESLCHDHCAQIGQAYVEVFIPALEVEDDPVVVGL